MSEPCQCSIEECGAPARYGRLALCTKHYQRIRKYGTAEDPSVRRFWASVDKTDGCWNWTGFITPKGYGQFSPVFGSRLPHRIAYEFLVGPIPDGLVLDHLCRNRACCNPAHLDPVDHRENLRRGEHGRFWGFVPDVPERRPRTVPPAVCAEEGCDRKPYKRGICRPHYRRWLKDPNRTSDRLAVLAMTVEERFWSKVDRRGPDECWPWRANTNRITGYGMFARKHNEPDMAHRVAYELAVGPIPPRMDIHHTCFTRACVNPAHLELVTRSENLARRMARRID